MYEVSPRFKADKIFLIQENGKRTEYKSLKDFIDRAEFEWVWKECGSTFKDRRRAYHPNHKFNDDLHLRYMWSSWWGSTTPWYPTYIIRTESGLIIHPKDIIPILYKKSQKRRTRYLKYFTYRQTPVPGISGSGYSGHGRRIRIMQEKRKCYDTKFEINYNLNQYVEIKPRGKRNKKWLPNPWDDDISKQWHKNWKHYRDHQWKESKSK